MIQIKTGMLYMHHCCTHVVLPLMMTPLMNISMHDGWGRLCQLCPLPSPLSSLPSRHQFRPALKVDRF